MEWILVGIAIAIGFYIAPIVITFVIAAILAFFAFLAVIWNTITGRDRTDY